MELELKALIDSFEFGRYHKKLHSRAFSPFDVLQVAEVEIRHSNVLAWLLTPDGTHGIGGRFLRAFVGRLMLRHDAASLRRLSGFDDKDNVEVRREDYHEGSYADITVGFKAERVLLVIENKVVGWYPEAERQIESYQKTFGEKYKGRYDYFPGVLLTTSNSPAGNDAELHMRDVSFALSWGDVREIIRSLLNDRESENFADGHVRAFVERYLDVIEEKLIHTGDDLVERLRNDHPRIFEKLEEEPALLDKLDEPTRATIKRLLDYFEGRPRTLRETVAEYLKLKPRGADVKRSSGRGKWKSLAFLYWETPSGGKLHVDECAWYFTFGPRKVVVEFLTPWERGPKKPTNPNMQKVWSFLQRTPVDPARPERYPMENGFIYRQDILKDAELAGPFEESVKLLHHRLDQFFGPDGDYERIERYFKCLAFDPRAPGHPVDGETAP